MQIDREEEKRKTERARSKNVRLMVKANQLGYLFCKCKERKRDKEREKVRDTARLEMEHWRWRCVTLLFLCCGHPLYISTKLFFIIALPHQVSQMSQAQSHTNTYAYRKPISIARCDIGG